MMNALYSLNNISIALKHGKTHVFKFSKLLIAKLKLFIADCCCGTLAKFKLY